jgi:hypothetical protein
MHSAVALSFGLSYISDMFQTRWLILFGLAIVGFPPLVILCVWNVPVGALYYACESVCTSARDVTAERLIIRLYAVCASDRQSIGVGLDE